MSSGGASEQCLDRRVDLARLLHVGQVTVFEDAGHLAHMEKANEVNAAIEALLARAA